MYIIQIPSVAIKYFILNFSFIFYHKYLDNIYFIYIYIMPRLKTRKNRKIRKNRKYQNRKTRNRYKKLYGGRSKRRICKRLKTRKNRKHKNKKQTKISKSKKMYGGMDQREEIAYEDCSNVKPGTAQIRCFQRNQERAIHELARRKEEREQEEILRKEAAEEEARKEAEEEQARKETEEEQDWENLTSRTKLRQQSIEELYAEAEKLYTEGKWTKGKEKLNEYQKRVEETREEAKRKAKREAKMEAKEMVPSSEWLRKQKENDKLRRSIKREKRGRRGKGAAEKEAQVLPLAAEKQSQRATEEAEEAKQIELDQASMTKHGVSMIEEAKRKKAEICSDPSCRGPIVIGPSGDSFCTNCGLEPQ